MNGGIDLSTSYWSQRHLLTSGMQPFMSKMDHRSNYLSPPGRTTPKVNIGLLGQDYMNFEKTLSSKNRRQRLALTATIGR